MFRSITFALAIGMMPASSYSADTVHRLCVRNFTGVSISNSEVESILIQSSAILHALGEQFPGCKSVALKQKGVLKSFDGEFPSSVTSEFDFQRIKQDSCIKIVERITWCSGPRLNGTVLGCAPLFGRGIAAVRRVSAFNIHDSLRVEPITWLHEYGHNLGLPHNESGSNSFMSPGLSPDKIGGTAEECSVFTDGQAAVAVPDGTPLGTPMTGVALPATDPNFVAGMPMPAEGVAQYTDDFMEFIKQPMSNKDISKFAREHEADIDKFNKAILDIALRPYKNNIAGILTVIGNRESYDATWKYVETRYNDPTDFDVNGLLAAVLTLGVLIERLDLSHEEVLRIGELRNPEFWLSRLIPEKEYTTIEDTDVPVLSKEQVERAAFDLADQATNGFALTGSPAAGEALQSDINSNASAALPEPVFRKNESILRGAESLNAIARENGALSVFEN